MTALLGVHVGVTCYAKSSCRGAHISVPSNLNLVNWAALCVTIEDTLVLQYLQFGFPAGYEGPVPTPVFIITPLLSISVVMWQYPFLKSS